MHCKSVLIVEDDDSIRQTLRLALELEGYEVKMASNGEEGLERLGKMSTPCLILLDLMMPVMDGWRFAEALVEDHILAKVPIAVVTAYGERAQTFARAAAVITKPVNLDSLFQIVARYCRRGVKS